MNRDSTELLPCPFCGSAGLTDMGGSIGCLGCDASGPYVTDGREREAWNTRSAQPIGEEMGWQPYETAPVNEVVDWWIEDEIGMGWRKTGERQVSGEPLCIVEEDGSLYWPHENGGWPTHWREIFGPRAAITALKGASHGINKEGSDNV